MYSHMNSYQYIKRLDKISELKEASVQIMTFVVLVSKFDILSHRIAESEDNPLLMNLKSANAIMVKLTSSSQVHGQFMDASTTYVETSLVTCLYNALANNIHNYI